MKKVIVLASLVFVSSAFATVPCPSSIVCTDTNYKNCLLKDDNFAWYFVTTNVVAGTYSFAKADFAGKVYKSGINTSSNQFNPGQCYYQNGSSQIILKSKLGNLAPKDKDSKSSWIWTWGLMAQCHANSASNCQFEFYN